MEYLRNTVFQFLRKPHLVKRLSSNVLLTLVASFLFVVIETKLIFTPLSDVEIDQLEKYKIIPDYISMPPDYKIEVTYPRGGQAAFGNLLNEKKLNDTPKCKWDADKEDWFTLMMINPDRTHKDPVAIDYLNWLVVNIKYNNVSSGETICEYEPPLALEPFPRFHKYIFLLFHQPEGQLHIDKSYLNKRFRRSNFSVHDYADMYEFEEPIAVNFIRCYSIIDNADMLPLHPKDDIYNPDLFSHKHNYNDY